MSVRARLQRINVASSDPDSITDLARDALAEGEEEAAAPLVLAAAAKWNKARLWQWAGLLHRALDEHVTAIECLAMAARLAPNDAKVAQALAHVSLEAGCDAEALFERALSLSPANPAVLIGRSAARMATGHGCAAIDELEAVLEGAPGWIDGHAQIAQLRSLLGNQPSGPDSLERAIAKYPYDRALWLAQCDLGLRRGDFAKLQDDVAGAEAAGVAGPDLHYYRAVAAGESGSTAADQLLSEAAAGANPALALWRIRHLLRCDRITDVLPLIDHELQSERRQAIWPYAATAWRLAGDCRSQWLDDRPGLVAEIDVALDLAALARRLRGLHERSGRFSDQSVRGGSQTDGPLLSRIEPEIRSLRTVLEAGVAKYVANLPTPDRDHPSLGPPRNRRIRFAGSWSVRLLGRGHHTNHVHPNGWISSALYISLPERNVDDPAEAGWLVLGEPDQRLGVAMKPGARVEPALGKLVLFPSWMWHGTRSFAEGERLTVAFDVATPR